MPNEEFNLILKSLHMKQVDLAKAWGVANSSVKKWASGDENLPPERLATLKQWQLLSEKIAKSIAKRVIKDMETLKMPSAALLIYDQSDWEYLECSQGIPTQVHQSAVARAKFLLEQKGHAVEIKRFTP